MLKRFVIPVHLRYSVLVIGLLLCVNFILRLMFLGYNYHLATNTAAKDIFSGFLLGMRFDLATILIFSGLFLGFMALPLKINMRPSTLKVLNIVIIIANAPVLIMNSIDVVYFGFSEKRLTHELFTTQSDFGSFQPEILMEWWWLFMMFFLIIWLMYKVLDRLSIRYLAMRRQQAAYPRWFQWCCSGVFLILMMIGLRGGVRGNPLWMGQAFRGNGVFAGNLALNSGFTVFSSMEWGSEDLLKLVPEREAIITTRELVRNGFDGPFVSEHYPLLRETQFGEPEKDYNVVFLIIESLNAKNVGCIGGKTNGINLTPNLDALAAEGRMFTNFHANGIRSVESIPSILNSMPEVFKRPTIGSQYEENNHFGIGNILDGKGYTTAFFCGAHNGTMGFDRYSKISGIENYYGMDEYPWSERDFNGHWGCDDGPFLSWMADKQSGFREPFMSVFFSISNHHPFILPKNNTDDIGRLPLSDMEKTIMYTDRALGEYFQKVKSTGWYKRTIFVVTGDHCFHEKPDPNATLIGNYHVPLLMIGPDIEPGYDDRLGSHVNIMPTIIDLLKLHTWHNSSAISLFDSTNSSYFMTNLMGVALMAREKLAVSTTFEFGQSCFRFENEKWEKVLRENCDPMDVARMEYLLRCTYQFFHNSRIENRMQGLSVNNDIVGNGI